MAQTLFEKVWNQHAVRRLPTGQTQLYIGLHLIHEVTSPQAFDMLRARGWKVRAPHRTFATVDHIVPTASVARPFADVMAEQMTTALERNCTEHKIPLFDLTSGRQGIVHVIGPELGLTRPGMTIACGDSHTSTHGAFGALAFGIGTSQVRDVLASQCLAMTPLKVRRIRVVGTLAPGVYAKDIILTIIQRLGVEGGVGFAYEYAGDTIERLSMDERMTICNMSIEGGARIGYVNPDETTANYLAGRLFAPLGAEFARAKARWAAFASDPGAQYDDEVEIRAEEIAPTVTWGTNPGQSVGVGDRLPTNADAESLAFMGFHAGQPIAGTKVDVAFIGSCTNGRLSDLREAARVIAGRKVSPNVRAMVVPGSQAVLKSAEAEGLHEIFRAAGFDWRGAGCSMCLAMNPDRLNGSEVCASSSNRNFKGRQGSPTGRTLLMSPAMVAAAAIEGAVVDVRKAFTHEGASRAMKDFLLNPSAITRVAGTAIVLRGNDIDTDRIIPARFLKTVTFDGLAANLFADDRAQMKASGSVHPFDASAAAGASVLIVNKNFGCGSSREHAPQALYRRGIRVVIAESFAEIFASNSLMIGLACVTVSSADIQALMMAVDWDPTVKVTVNLESGTATAGGQSWPVDLPPHTKHALITGQWDGAGLLLENYGEVDAVDASLPYSF